MQVLELINYKYIALLLIIFIPLERLFPANRSQKIFRKGWQTDLAYLIINGALISTGLVAMIIGYLAIQAYVTPVGVVAAIGSQPIWLQVIELIVFTDLIYYFMHRLFHAVPFLWRFHAIHHSSENLDWLAGHRVHAIDQILSKGASLAPAFILGFNDAAIIIYSFIFQWHSVLLHANIPIRLGPLTWLVATPEFHHWHHTNRKEAHDKNFSGQFPLWDRIFGTAYLPDSETPGDYGVDDHIPSGFVSHFFHPFKQEPQQTPPLANPANETLDAAALNEEEPSGATILN